ncbi:hypothetical protein [Streptomyces sp. NPDC049744]|uniref:MmyB family transcriptional regulator n=1 Tax=Streptomyces sp. NPDC049744 TaxID=3154359 RepID=UPI00343E4632
MISKSGHQPASCPGRPLPRCGTPRHLNRSPRNLAGWLTTTWGTSCVTGAALQPDDVGMASYGSRRFPGLRREEAVVLAGINVGYYSRLEHSCTPFLGSGPGRPLPSTSPVRRGTRPLANLRHAAGPEPQGPWLQELVEYLIRAGVDFNRLWSSHIIRGKTPEAKRFMHPDVGP